MAATPLGEARPQCRPTLRGEATSRAPQIGGLKGNRVAGGLFRRRSLDLLRSLIGEQRCIRRRQCRAVIAEFHPTLDVEVRALPAAEARPHEDVREGHDRIDVWTAE